VDADPPILAAPILRGDALLSNRQQRYLVTERVHTQDGNLSKAVYRTKATGKGQPADGYSPCLTLGLIGFWDLGSGNNMTRRNTRQLRCETSFNLGNLPELMIME